MAGTAAEVRMTGVPGSDLRHLVITVNKLIDDVELIRAALVATCTKMDSDAGITDTNYAAQATVAAISPASDLTAYKLNENGSAVTA
jgi:hypothetical protein